MPSGIRLQRIADRIRQELSEMLIREISDPRLKLIYVTDVKVDRELAYADVYVSAVEGVSRSADVLAGFLGDGVHVTIAPRVAVTVVAGGGRVVMAAIAIEVARVGAHWRRGEGEAEGHSNSRDW